MQSSPLLVSMRVLVLALLLMIVALAPAQHSVIAQPAQAVQNYRIDNMADILAQQNVSIIENAKRIESLENDVSTMRGAVLGFGALLSVLQLVGLIKRKQGA
jgi:ABC-type uncharacterized transport system permease subunit